MEQDRIEQQLDLFASCGEQDNKYKITKPIRLIELFAGVGAQFKALKLLTSKVESYKICEWAFNSIIAYNAVHIKDFTDYSIGKTKEEMINRIRGISVDYNQPLSDEQLNKKPIEWIKRAYNNIIATHNLVNIMEVKGDDLEIVDTDKYEYIMTYSFPCQDLSLAGKRAGMGVSQANGGTRSGLLWEVERILSELPFEQRPNVLLLENVPEACGTGNLEHWKKWVERLSQFGYQTFSNIINAKDYGIPQNRKRLFAISIKERERELAYQFPRKIKRKYDLEHFLEDSVDEKYFLTEQQYESIANWKAQQDPLAHINEKKAVSPCLTARGSTEMHSGMILVDESVYKGTFEYAKGKNFIEQDKRFHKGAKESQTLLASGNHNAIVVSANGIPIKNATKQGYLLAEKGDGVDIGGRMKYHRGTVQKGCAQTIKTTADVGVVVNTNDPLKGNNNE